MTGHLIEGSQLLIVDPNSWPKSISQWPQAKLSVAFCGSVVVEVIQIRLRDIVSSLKLIKHFSLCSLGGKT